MPRVAIVAVTCVLGLVAATAVAAWWTWDAAVAAGVRIYSHRPYLERLVAAPALARPLVVWMGDSTIIGATPSYPQRLAQDWQAAGEPGEQRVIGFPGLDFYDYYFVLGPVLDLRPDLLVLVAHLRMFGRNPGVATFTDLSSMLPLAELQRTVRLPLHERGITLPRLLLARLLRFAPAEQAFFFFEGLRTLVQEVGVWELLGPRRPRWNLATAQRAAPTIAPATLQMYDVPLSARQPVVRMLAATVRMARARGVPVLVVASPIPTARLRALDAYDERTYDARFAVLRDATEAAGGAFLDLHAAVPDEEFQDGGGHYKDAGARRLAAMIDPHVRAALARRDGHGP